MTLVSREQGLARWTLHTERDTASFSRVPLRAQILPVKKAVLSSVDLFAELLLYITM